MKQRVRLSRCKNKHSRGGFSHMSCYVEFNDVFGNHIAGDLSTRRSSLHSSKKMVCKSYCGTKRYA